MRTQMKLVEEELKDKMENMEKERKEEFEKYQKELHSFINLSKQKHKLHNSSLDHIISEKKREIK